jgi:hypothetical protein
MSAAEPEFPIDLPEPEVWSAERWIEWLRRGPKDLVPHWSGLCACADALEAALREARGYPRAVTNPACAHPECTCSARCTLYFQRGSK